MVRRGWGNRYWNRNYYPATTWNWNRYTPGSTYYWNNGTGALPNYYSYAAPATYQYATPPQTNNFQWPASYLLYGGPGMQNYIANSTPPASPGDTDSSADPTTDDDTTPKKPAPKKTPTKGNAPKSKSPK